MPESYWSLDGFIDAFVANLGARPGLAEVQVTDSWPGEVQQTKSIWIEDAHSSEAVAGMSAGPARYNEEYSVYVICDVYVPGGSTKDARDQLTPLVGEVMREVAENKRQDVGGGKVTSVRIAGWRYRPYVLKEGRGVACRIEVKVSGRR